MRFSHFLKYIMENWVWLCRLGLELRLQHSCGPFLSSSDILLCQQGGLSGATEILLSVWLRPLQPPTIPQFLPPCSRVTGLCNQSRLFWKIYLSWKIYLFWQTYLSWQIYLFWQIYLSWKIYLLLANLPILTNIPILKNIPFVSLYSFLYSGKCSFRNQAILRIIHTSLAIENSFKRSLVRGTIRLKCLC